MSVRVPSHIHFRPVHDEVVLLDTRTGSYRGLNPSATVIWLSLADGADERTAVSAVLDRFDVSSEQAQADLDILVQQLVADGLLERGDG
ncbi:MAG: PqqD family protein [Chloroflexia bacterium]|nr:PqqD family protein [Chloroflexia bacterium]